MVTNAEDLISKLPQDQKDLYHKNFKLENETFSHPYTAGHAYMWKSDIWHKIGDVSLNGDDYRITFQGHLIVHSNKLLYYW